MPVKNERGKGKQRGTGIRQRKSIVLFATEGNNKTETLYFKNFNQKNLQIKFTRGNETDPEKMMKRLLDEADDMGLGSEPGDCAFSLVDGDVNPKKDGQIMRADAMARGTKATQIVSNPCFEIWYSCHYGYSTRQYHSTDEAIAALRELVPAYSKENPGMYQLTIHNVNKACDNAIRLEQYNQEAGRKLHTADYLPSTDVYKVIIHLLKQNNNDSSDE